MARTPGPGPEVPDRYLTAADVATLLGVRARTVPLWVQRYGLPCVRLSGATIRYRRAEVEEWVRRRSAAETATVAPPPTTPGPRKRGRPRRTVGGGAA